jgi:small subunit ribosomal protein S16
MLKIRLQRIGRHKEPHYRVVVIEVTRGPKSSDYIEELGSYNPKAGLVLIKADRAQYWISVGAQASDTVHNMLVKNKVIDAPVRKVVINKNRKSKKK